MFFRRPKVRESSFAERLDALKTAGFAVEPERGGVRVSRGGCAIVLGGQTRAGILLDGEIAQLVDGGFQKFFRAPSGRRKPALASELKALHAFEEDIKEALGTESYYNESLGTVSTYYSYDRLQGRDTGAAPRPWETNR